jgi:benzoylformate decarboxylase
MDLPGLDIVWLGKGYGAISKPINTLDELKDSYTEALRFKGVTVLAVQITRKLDLLLG